jgi:hypothetical protein
LFPAKREPRKIHSVDLKRRPPKSRPAISALGFLGKGFPIAEAARRTPPSTFLFLPIHLSNIAEPVVWSRPPGIEGRAAETRTSDMTILLMAG